MNLTIRPMRESDLDSLAAVERACFSHPWSRTALAAELADPAAVFLTACLNETVVGYVGMQAVLGEGYLANLAVSPENRRQGVGESLMCALIRYAETHAMAFLTLEVRASNRPAIALYEKLGFAPVGRRPRFYEDPTEDALLMTKRFPEESAQS